ncbi:hypothetical protein STAS_31602 [Striga asiatica]|uniref:Uncharacterized protein n=1 Tax=Striga asiatica TaxID=4170 RepID=A0A5A7RBQ0_STRAF|nr:hypothetical protein STAS_31602 [Striga asiatica]
MANHNEHHSNIKSVNHPDKFYYLKKALQVLFSLSIFSLLFYHPSLAPFFVQSYDYFSSNISIKLFTCTTERNCIFLICNGILVLIIRTSGLVRKIAPVKISPKDVRIDVCNMEEVDEAKGANAVMKVEVLEVKGSDRVEKGGIFDPGHEIDKREIDHEAQEEDDDDEEEEEEEEDGDENDDEQLMSTDELNKKCEDFIKRVKQEIQGV